MAILTRNQILEAKDIKTKTVHVTEWGGDVIIKQLSAKEFNDISMNIVNIKKVAAKQLSNKNKDDFEDAINEIAIKNQKIMLIVKSLVDENMKPLFTEADLEILYTKNNTVIDRLISEIEEFNKSSVEETKKN